MMSALAALRNRVSRFHADEEGLEALQVVMILAVAAVCLIIVKTKWKDIKGWFNDMMNQATGSKNWSTK